MEYLAPPLLTRSDSVALVAPARWIEPELLEQTIAWLEREGLRAAPAPNLMARAGQLAGSDEARLSDLQWALDNDEVRAILAMRGGYGSHRLLDGLVLDRPEHSSKWFSGFSDMTAVHAHLQRHGLQSLHCAMPSTMPDISEISDSSICSAWRESILEHSWADEGPDALVSGRLFGGNLSVLHGLIGTPSWPEMQGGILFIEDLDEMLYHIDRMLIHLLRTGLLNGLQALLIGGMTEMRDNTISHGFSKDNPFGKGVTDMLVEICSRAEIPLFQGLSSGHVKENLPLRLGATTILQRQNGCCTVTQTWPT